MRELGCAVTSMAMTLTAFGDTVKPGQLNTWAKERHAKNGGYDRSNTNWDAIEILSYKKVRHEKHSNAGFPNISKATNVSILDDAIANCALVIANVFNGYKRNGDPKHHWVVVRGKDSQGRYIIQDPGYQNRITLDSYNNKFWTYLLVHQ